MTTFFRLPSSISALVQLLQRGRCAQAQPSQRRELEDLANLLGIDLRLESQGAPGATLDLDESRRSVKLSEVDEGGRLQQLEQCDDGLNRCAKQKQQPEDLNSFARQLEEQLTSIHREKPLGMEEGNYSENSEQVPIQEVSMHTSTTERPNGDRALVNQYPCEQCSAVLPSGDIF